MQVRIIAVPPGAAPAVIRREWVGLVLPLAPEFGHGPAELVGYGVLSRRPEVGPIGRLWRRLCGRSARPRQYAVPADEAVARLAAVAPDAARWWRENAPYPFGVGERFGFAAEVWEEVE